MFSKACIYGIKALGFIVKESQKGNRVKAQFIAKEASIPEAFTAKVLQKLVRANIVKSIKGPKGGFEIDLELLPSLRLADVVYAIDGPDAYSQCVLGNSECNHLNPCEIHERYTVVMNSFLYMIESTTLEELAEKSRPMNNK